MTFSWIKWSLQNSRHASRSTLIYFSTFYSTICSLYLKFVGEQMLCSLYIVLKFKMLEYEMWSIGLSIIDNVGEQMLCSLYIVLKFKMLEYEMWSIGLNTIDNIYCYRQNKMGMIDLISQLHYSAVSAFRLNKDWQIPPFMSYFLRTENR